MRFQQMLPATKKIIVHLNFPILPAAAVLHDNPEICVFKVRTIIFNNVFRVALLHDADLLDDFLQVRLDGNLFDRKNLREKTM